MYINLKVLSGKYPQQIGMWLESRFPRNMNNCFQSFDIEAKVPSTEPCRDIANKESNFVLVTTKTRGKFSPASEVAGA